MARPKKSETETTPVVEQTENTTEVEQTEKPVDVVETSAGEETKPVEKPETEKAENKSIKGNVVIKCVAYAGKSIVLPTRTISLDEKGCCEVTDEEATRLLTIPGYELAK